MVTKIFCSKYGCASAFSAKSPYDLGSLANLAVFVLQRSEYKYCACPSPIPLLLAALGLIHEKNSRVRLCGLELFHPQDSP